jgi:hypothetical protein
VTADIRGERLKLMHTEWIARPFGASDRFAAQVVSSNPLIALRS